MPFTQDREDWRTSLLASMMLNASGNFKKIFPPDYFLPNYFNDKPTPMIVEKSLEQQKQEALAFRQRFMEVNKHAT